MSSESLPPEPWHSFLRDLDEALQSPARLDCIGGFVVTQLYGLDRPTADVDVIELAPREASETLMKIAMQGGALHRKHRIYLDRVPDVTMKYIASQTSSISLGVPEREVFIMKCDRNALGDER
jgi:hypothetical protein